MKFKGTIIITDPCYITSSHDDWRKCSYGDNMEAFGNKSLHNRIHIVWRLELHCV